MKHNVQMKLNMPVSTHEALKSVQPDKSISEQAREAINAFNEGRITLPPKEPLKSTSVLVSPEQLDQFEEGVKKAGWSVHGAAVFIMTSGVLAAAAAHTRRITDVTHNLMS